jgi:hypothetical protein
MRMAVSIDKVATIGPRADEFEAAGGAIERMGRFAGRSKTIRLGDLWHQDEDILRVVRRGAPGSTSIFGYLRTVRRLPRLTRRIEWC